MRTTNLNGGGTKTNPIGVSLFTETNNGSMFHCGINPQFQILTDTIRIITRGIPI